MRQANLTSAEELATLLEPLVQAMAALTEETRASLEPIGLHSRAQSEQFRAQVEMAITCCRNATIAAEKAAERLNQAGRRMEVSHYLLALLAGITTGLLVTVF